jgi:hypothetical protein
MAEPETGAKEEESRVETTEPAASVDLEDMPEPVVEPAVEPLLPSTPTSLLYIRVRVFASSSERASHTPAS